MNRLQPVRGTKDILPEEALKFQWITDQARYVAEAYNFVPFSTPIFEDTEVFKRTLGETSDVVNKEMYTFESKGGEFLTLRPEFTAGIARAFISNGMQQNLPLKLFSYGPLFRYERPQKGRQRQFHQVNFEWLGAEGPESDVQLILLAVQFLDELGVLPDTRLEINTLGDNESRRNYTQNLVEYLQKYENDLSQDSRERLRKNPLRILDSKDKSDRDILVNAPSIHDCLSQEAARYFETVMARIQDVSMGIFDVEFIPNSRIVRGLDYYNHTVFEFISGSSRLGAQNTILAGGRYDGLIQHLGGPHTPSIGFAAGLERLALVISDDEKIQYTWRPVAVVASGKAETTREALRLATALRAGAPLKENDMARSEHFIPTEFILAGNISKGLKKANKLRASHVIIIGDDEISTGHAIIKNLDSGDEIACPVPVIPEKIIEILKDEQTFI